MLIGVKRPLVGVDVLERLFRAPIPSAWRFLSFILRQKMQEGRTTKGIVVENESSLGKPKKGRNQFKNRKAKRERRKSWNLQLKSSRRASDQSNWLDVFVPSIDATIDNAQNATNIKFCIKKSFGKPQANISKFEAWHQHYSLSQISV